MDVTAMRDIPGESTSVTRSSRVTSRRVVTAILLAVLIAAGLWWSYFGYLQRGAERRLRGTGSREPGAGPAGARFLQLPSA